MARVVQRANQADVDSSAVDDRDDLANPLSGDCDYVRLRFRAMVSRKAAYTRRAAVPGQFDRQFGFHADSVRDAQFAAGDDRYLDRLGIDPVDNLRDLAAPQMDRGGSVAVFGLGFNRNRTSIDHHLEQLAVIFSACGGLPIFKATFNLTRI